MATYRESIVVYIACDPPAVLWNGPGWLPLPADVVLPAPMTALGGGRLVQVPDIEQLINGTTQRADFVIDGVDEESVRLVREDAPSVEGAAVHIGVAQFDGDWQLVAVEWAGKFEARSLAVSRPKVADGKVTRSITLTIVAGESLRSRAPNAYFTDADQRRKSPTDAIFSHVGRINSGTSRRFGPAP